MKQIEFRCSHWFMRSLVPCQACGDPDWLNVSAARHVENKRRIRAARAARSPVISHPHGRTAQPSYRGRGV